MTQIGAGEGVLGEAADAARESIAAFMTARSRESEVRRLIETDSGFDASVWEQMAHELELQGMALPERFGGGGFGWAAQAVVFEEMGRVLMCAPYLSTVLFSEALLATGDDDACEAFLPGVANGSIRGTLAWSEGSDAIDVTNVDTAADAAGAQARLTGEKLHVIDGASAGVLLVTARAPDGVGLFVVDAEAPGVSRAPAQTLDLSRKQARVRFDGALGRRVGQGRVIENVARRVELVAGVALAAECVGVARAGLVMAVEYAKVRMQFGRPIGSFQAVKHRCADMLRNTEQARAAAYEAAIALESGDRSAPLVGAIAKAYCTHAAAEVTAANVHVHGGIGYTWEHPAHLYYRRAASNEELFGSSRYQRRRVLQEMEI